MRLKCLVMNINSSRSIWAKYVIASPIQHKVY